MDAKKLSTFACDACRLGKRKCDASKPRCDRCQKQDKLCIYPTEERPKRRKYWDEDYVANLETQVKTLLAALEAKNAESTTVIEASNSSQEYTVMSRAVNDEDDVERCNKAHSEVTHNEPCKTEIDDAGPEDRSLTAMEELSVMMWRTNIGDGVKILGDDEADTHDIVEDPQSTAATSFPVPPNVLRLSQDLQLMKESSVLFLGNINSEHQFTYYKTTEFLEGFPFQDVNETFLHSAILATGALFSTRSDAKEIAEVFAQFAESLVFTCFRHGPCIKVIQGLCIMSWRSLALGRDHFGWMFISMAAGLCVHLRLHVLALDECGARAWTPQREDIRTFWMFYLIDRTAISILGRNCVLPWRRVNVPSFEVLTEGKVIDCAQLSFMWQCRLWFLHDEQMDQIFTSKFESMSVQQQAHLLVSTHETLSTFFKNRDRQLDLHGLETSKHVLFFHMAYQMALLITLPPFLRCFAMSQGQSKAENMVNADYIVLILRSLTSAATMMIRLVRSYRDNQPEQWKRANPVVIHHLLSAAIVLLMNATSHTTSLKIQSSRWLKICLELLIDLRSPWPDRVNKTIKVIQVLATRWGVLGALPLQFSYPVATSSITSQGSAKETSMDGLTFTTYPYSERSYSPGLFSSISGRSRLCNEDPIATILDVQFHMPRSMDFDMDKGESFEGFFADIEAV